MNLIIKILLAVWQLPQLFVGLGVLIYLKWKGRNFIRDIIESWGIERLPGHSYPESLVYRVGFRIGVSFGPIVFLDRLAPYASVRHELGHSGQSLILGPLYLIVVGIPSFIMSLMSSFSYRHSSGKFYAGYYKRFPENWADWIGGVKRDA